MPNTRLAAVQTLSEIFDQGARPKESLKTQAESFDRRDRAFLMEIVYGVVRYRDALDWILAHFLKNPARLGSFTLNNLRIAAYQIYFMRVPDWAVVNESVELEKLVSSPVAPPKNSLVNAVLRNILRQKEKFVLPAKFDDPVSAVSVNTSHPKWMVKRWIKRFGEQEASLLAEANNRIAAMTIRTNTLRTTREELLGILSERGADAEPTRFSPDGIILRDISTYEELTFIRGLFVVQDEASQLISYLLDPQPGQRILDACAAPGGKTTHIAQIMKDRGEIVAVEKDSSRVMRIRENIETLGLKSVTIIDSDIAKLDDADAFDRILVDAPCSATGVIRRNPDVKYRYQAKDLLAFKNRQVSILRAASRFLKEDGLLVYSVCSIEPEEGEDVAREFLKTEAKFRIIDKGPLFLKDFVSNGFFRTYPHRHTMDGFFGVSLCKKR
ncbi:MAG: 16S rRNA (cytosine(967)-C(5))-methyltransferase RsmB [Nitrospirae bacterium]|nr:16S rRNA (cytosine(967)-C(5))-methyltransferase RsmB [Nitrospirota bacterium]